MKVSRKVFISSIYIFICITYTCAVTQYVPVNLSFEYPYTCGTWFNRGKNTCNMIIKKLEENKISVRSSIKGFHSGEFPQGYNGEFNIYMDRPEGKILLATSDSNSKFFHAGLKYFAYTFYRIDESNGEKQYLEEFPQKDDLLEFVVKRTVEVLKNKNLK